MKLCILTLFFWFTFIETPAAAHIPSDAEVLSTGLSTAIQKLLNTSEPFPGKLIFISYSSGFLPSNLARETVEAFFTGYGCAIVGNEDKANVRVLISITDARVILNTHNNEYNRTVWITVHLKCLDSSHRVLFASGQEEIINDVLPKKFLRLTDDSERFCENVQRRIIKKNNGMLLFLSFALITGILSYFAFQ